MNKTARYILDESTKLTTKAQAVKLSKGTKWNLDKLYQDYRDSNCSLSVDGVGDDRILTITKENGEALSFDVNDNIVYEQGEELKEYINLTKRNILQEYALLDEKKKIKKNILKRTAEKHKKTDTEHAMGWFKGSHPKGATLNTNAGNVEKNVEFFNHAMGNTTSTADGGVGTVASAGNGGGMGEALNPLENHSPYVEDGTEDIGITKMLSDLIKDEWEAIDGYKSAISTLTSIEANPEIVEVLQNISSEEMAHIGELEHCMSLVSPEVSEIESGKDEAKETIDDSFNER